MPITIIPQSAQSTDLKLDGPSARSLSDPPVSIQSLKVALEGAGENRCGLWEASVGRFERHLPGAEIMHILTGECTFTPTGGTPQHIRAGDSLFFPANTNGVWDITSPLRKLYVVIPAA
jgi:uncharacterized protein